MHKIWTFSLLKLNDVMLSEMFYYRYEQSEQPIKALLPLILFLKN